MPEFVPKHNSALTGNRAPTVGDAPRLETGEYEGSAKHARDACIRGIPVLLGETSTGRSGSFLGRAAGACYDRAGFAPTPLAS